MFSLKLQRVLATKRPFIHDRINLTGFGLAAAVVAANFVWLLLKIQPTSTETLLHYNAVYGLSVVEQSYYLYLIPGLGLAIWIVNMVLAARFFQKEKLVSYFISFGTLAVQLIFLAATAAIIIANE